MGIVLSGTGTDGTLGMRAIREANGLTMAQAPAEAQFHAMPASAIDTGLVDITGPADELARRLVSMRATIGDFKLPVVEEAPADTENKLLEKILARVQAETDHDFTGYKRSTVLRRIARRMQANEVDSLGQYLDYIAEHEGETRSLFRGLLISVTNFFRDPDAFQTLSEQVIPRILAEKERGDAVRLWVPGCATGEEAYSLSILMAEAVHRTEEVPTVQIFGTDVDGEAILRARQGLYPDSISVDVSSERLDRFFIRENSHYRVRKHIRETVLFARHNLLRDPPFSEIDLISCRNVLIYLQRKQQEPVFEMFHFALRNGGYLFLGPSESAESVTNLFTVIDKKTSIYRRRPGTSHPIRFSSMLVNKPDGLQVPRGTVEDKKSREVDYAEKHRGLIVDQYSPTSILVREDYTVVDVAKRGSALLQYPEGQAPHAVLDIVADDLRPPLRTALFQFFKKGESSEKTVRSGSGENEQLVRLVVQKVEFDDGMAQVLLERGGEVDGLSEEQNRPAETDQLVEQLQEELSDTKEQLQSTIEQYETSTEELRASNEELLSMNEELQSTTEELETGREELQSMNEELSTVNSELERKVEELERANSDLENFMSAADIGTIFLDREYRVRRYTARVTQVFNLISSDVGRSITHITHNLEYEDLSRDVQEVFENHAVVEREISTTEDTWYIMRIRPYRSTYEKVSGVVLSFFDITRRKQAEE